MSPDTLPMAGAVPQQLANKIGMNMHAAYRWMINRWLFTFTSVSISRYHVYESTVGFSEKSTIAFYKVEFIKIAHEAVHDQGRLSVDQYVIIRDDKPNFF